MHSISVERGALFAVLALLGCSERLPLDLYDNTQVLRDALAPNATLVTIALDETSLREGSMATVPSSSHDLQGRVKLETLTDGFVAVLAVSREEVMVNDAGRKLGLVRGSTVGLRALEADAARSVVAPFGDEAVLVTCGVDDFAEPMPSTSYLSDASEGFVLLSESGATCEPYRAGRAQGPDEALILQNDRLSRWTLDRGSRLLSREIISGVPIELSNSRWVLFAEESSPDEFVFVTFKPGTSELSYHRATSAQLDSRDSAQMVTHTTTAIPDLDDFVSIVGFAGLVGVHRAADNALRVVTPTALWRWNVDALELPVKLADVPAPPVDTEWRSFGIPGCASAWTAIPNPLNESELYPTAATVRVLKDDAFVTFEPSPTPCCDPAACRQAAESYVLGGVEISAQRLTFYDLWTWVGTNEHAMVVAGVPLECVP